MTVQYRKVDTPGKHQPTKLHSSSGCNSFAMIKLNGSTADAILDPEGNKANALMGKHILSIIASESTDTCRSQCNPFAGGVSPLASA